MSDVIKNKKLKQKHKKSISNDSHHRNDSKSSKKSRKHSKKKSNRQESASTSKYMKINHPHSSKGKTRNHMYQSSVSSQCTHSYKNNLRFQDQLKTGFTPSNYSSCLKDAKMPTPSPFLTRMSKKSKKSRNGNVLKVCTTNSKYSQPEFGLSSTSSNKVSLISNPQLNNKKSRNTVFNQIKTTNHEKNNSENFFNIPWYAYGTNDKSLRERSRKSSGSKSSKRSRGSDGISDENDSKQNALQALIAKKLYQQMMSVNPGSQIVPIDNSSGMSTQGSSTKDFRSSAKKRKAQQECYYKSPAPQHPFICWQGENKFEHVQNNNIFIVEESKRPSEDEIKMIHKKVKSNRKKLHEYMLPDSHEDLHVKVA